MPPASNDRCPTYASTSTPRRGSASYIPYLSPAALDERLDHPRARNFHRLLLLLVGLVWMSESMEMLLISFISPSLSCFFNLAAVSAAALTTAVGAGMLLGNLLWGRLSDTHGRRRPFIVSTNIAALASLLCASAQSYSILLFFRFLVGVGIGGSVTAVTVLAELAPRRARGAYAVALAAFWGAGAVAEAGLAWVVLPSHGWRALVLASALPMLLVAVAVWWVPESPAWLLSRGRTAEADKVLVAISGERDEESDASTPGDEEGGEQCAQGEDSPLTPAAKHSEHGEDEGAEAEEGSKNTLWMKGVRHIAVLICALYFISAFLYYGMVLLQPTLLAMSPDSSTSCPRSAHDAASTTSSLTRTSSAAAVERDTFHLDCRHILVGGDYLSTLLSSLGELPGVLLAMPLVSLLGRRPTIAYTLALLCAAFALLSAFCPPRAAQTALFFAARGLSLGAFQALILLCAETYPPETRSLASGVASACSRVGLLLTPFVAQVLTEWSVRATLTVYAVVSAVGVALCVLLPVETAGRELPKSMPQLAALVKRGERNDDYRNDRTVPQIVRWLRWPAKVDGKVLKDKPKAR